jgi:hypothetical protein
MLNTQPPTLPTMPNSSNQKAAAQPAQREATDVSAMTPLFCANVVNGKEVASAEKMPLMPSLKMPPRMRITWSRPSTSKRVSSAVAVTSPTVSTLVMQKTIRRGKIAGAYIPAQAS